MLLLNPKYDGNGGLWRAKHPKIAAQGSIQIGGRKIALTVWTNDRPTGSDYNITINEQKTAHDDVVWFRSLHPAPLIDADALMYKGRKADIVIADDLTPNKALTDAADRLASTFDDDIPF